MQITLQNTDKGQCYAVRFDRYRQQVVDKFKSTVSVRWWDKPTGAWMVPANNKCKAELDQFSYYAKHFETIIWGNQVARQEEDVVYTLPDMPELEGDHGLKIQPYPYQLEGIARGLQLKRFINGDDMGLGKTLESIATINKAGAFPCLVICPNVVKINWQREWQKFTDKRAMVLTDSVRNSWPFYWQTGMNQVFIVNYESLKKYFVRRITNSEKWTLKDVEFHNTINLFKSVIIDESHKVKSTATQQSKFCKGIASGKEYIILLTGTPVVNKPNDLVCQLGIMDRMNDLIFNLNQISVVIFANINRLYIESFFNNSITFNIINKYLRKIELYFITYLFRCQFTTLRLKFNVFRGITIFKFIQNMSSSQCCMSTKIYFSFRSKPSNLI